MEIFSVKVNKSWERFIAESKYLCSMIDFINTTKNICPIKEKVFRFFECDVYNAKCIILGMDPYPSIYEKNGKKIPVATGRSFEVANVEKWTDRYKQISLSKIFKTLWYLKFDEIISIDKIRNNEKLSYFKYINIHNWFDSMEKEGVLFLNASLTTIIGKSGVHKTIWKDFINELFSFITKVNKNIKWLIWGNNAKEIVKNVVPVDAIIYTCHPATRIKNTFVEDCSFKKIKNISWV